MENSDKKKALELAIASIEKQFGKTKYGKVKYSKDALFWMGYIYRYISFTRDCDTRFLMNVFKHKQLNDLYYVYHTQDNEWCIKSLLELNGLDENVFDRNWRL